MSKGLEVWNAVKKYLNLYHHQAVKENIDVETVEGMPIDIIEKELKALEIIKRKCVDVCDITCYTYSRCNYNRSRQNLSLLTKEEYDLLKEVVKWDTN